MKYDRNKIRKAVAEYVYLLLDGKPENAEEAERFDKKRKKRHDAIFTALGKDPANYRDGHIADGLTKNWRAGFVDEEQYIDYHTDRLIDVFYNEENKYSSGIKISWESKSRIDYVLKTNKDRVGKQLAEVNKVMERAQKGLKDYNEDNPGKHVYTWDVGINVHDWNGLRQCIEVNWEKIETLSELPREAYTQVMVNEYFHKPLQTIDRLVKELESIAFLAERTPYYTYEKKGKTND